MIAMLFILFDIEVVFLYPVGVLVQTTKSVFVLVEILIFVVLLLVALVFVWRRGALDWSRATASALGSCEPATCSGRRPRGT